VIISFVVIWFFFKYLLLQKMLVSCIACCSCCCFPTVGHGCDVSVTGDQKFKVLTGLISHCFDVMFMNFRDDDCVKGAQTGIKFIIGS
jgi:hypothetical protein